jgi:hypothetical protein
MAFKPIDSTIHPSIYVYSICDHLLMHILKFYFVTLCFGGCKDVEVVLETCSTFR